MHWSLIILTATVLLHGVSCHLFPQAVLNQLVTNVEFPKQYKRQTTNELLGCVSDKLDVAFRGNTSSFVSECKSVAREEIDLSDILDTSNLTSLITSIFRTFPLSAMNRLVTEAIFLLGCVVVDLIFPMQSMSRGAVWIYTTILLPVSGPTIQIGCMMIATLILPQVAIIALSLPAIPYLKFLMYLHSL